MEIVFLSQLNVSLRFSLSPIPRTLSELIFIFIFGNVWGFLSLEAV